MVTFLVHHPRRQRVLSDENGVGRVIKRNIYENPDLSIELNSMILGANIWYYFC